MVEPKNVKFQYFSHFQVTQKKRISGTRVEKKTTGGPRYSWSWYPRIVK
jgi:hypothetical protein